MRNGSGYKDSTMSAALHNVSIEPPKKKAVIKKKCQPWNFVYNATPAYVNDSPGTMKVVKPNEKI